MKKYVLMGIALSLLSACAGSQGTMHKAEPQRAAEINLQLGIDYLRKNNLKDAKAKLDRALQQDPRNANAHAAAGLLYDRLGEQRKAESHFERAISLDSRNPEIRNNYAAVLCQHGNYDKGEKMALLALNDALYTTPEVALLNAGNCRLGAGDMQGAEAHFRNALQRRPRFAPALLQMAQVEFKQKNLLPARAFFERYMAATRPTAEGLLLGYRIERELGNQDQADTYARRLRNEFPTSLETKELIQIERQSG